MASCTYGKHRPILIMLGKQHHHTFENDMRVQLSLSFHFYLLYLLLNSCDRHDTKHNRRGGLVVGRRTCDLGVVGSRPGRDAAAQYFNNNNNNNNLYINRGTCPRHTCPRPCVAAKPRAAKPPCEPRPAA